MIRYDYAMMCIGICFYNKLWTHYRRY